MLLQAGERAPKLGELAALLEDQVRLPAPTSDSLNLPGTPVASNRTLSLVSSDTHKCGPCVHANTHTLKRSRTHTNKKNEVFFFKRFNIVR